MNLNCKMMDIVYRVSEIDVCVGELMMDKKNAVVGEYLMLLNVSDFGDCLILLQLQRCGRCWKLEMLQEIDPSDEGFLRYGMMEWMMLIVYHQEVQKDDQCQLLGILQHLM